MTDLFSLESADICTYSIAITAVWRRYAITDVKIAYAITGTEFTLPWIFPYFISILSNLYTIGPYPFQSYLLFNYGIILNPLCCCSEVPRRENNIRRILIKPFQFGFSEILQAGVSIRYQKPSTLRRPYISWSLHLRQIQYSYSVNSHDSSYQLLISDWRIF